MGGKEGGVQIPISAILKERQGRKNLKKLREDAEGGMLHVATSEDWLSIRTGLGDNKTRIILHYFELTEHLISEASIVFPSSEASFPEEAVRKAKAYDLEMIEVPGFTAVPKLFSLLRRHELDVDLFDLLWSTVVPGVPVPIPDSLSKHRTFDEEEFLPSVIGIDQKPSMVESDGETPYVVTFDRPSYLLVEGFPDQKIGEKRYYRGDQIKDPAPTENSPLLEMLHIPRIGYTRRQIQEANEEYSPQVFSALGLEPSAYRLHPIRYEDFLRVGDSHRWGRNSFATFLDGWHKKGSVLTPVIAGRSYSDSNYARDGFYEGLMNFELLPINWRGHAYEKQAIERREVMVRLAISARI